VSTRFYNAGLNQILANGVDNLSFELLLVDSSYTFSEDHDTYADGISANEITATNYARQALTVPSPTRDDATDLVSLFAGVSATFSSLGAGDSPSETAQAAVLGIDTIDVPVMYIDADVLVVLAAAAASSDTTIYVWPLESDLADNTALDFGAVTTTLNGAASAGDTALAVDALSGAISAGATADGEWSSTFPHTCDGATLTVVFPS
jgi:hypothetical protein